MTLSKLRERLGEIDRELLALIAERGRLASEIGRRKRDAGLPTRDFRQERDVIERARAAAAEHGLSPALGEALVLLLIDSSLTVQEREGVVARGGGSGRRVLIIGGGGNMGRWFARFLSAQGFDVEIADPAGPVPGYPHRSDWRAPAAVETGAEPGAETGIGHDIVIVAAPMPASGEILRELAEARPPGLVFDICSLKSPVRDGVRALVDAGVRVTSVHPMFGPDTELLSGRHVIFIDLGVPGAVAEARALFDGTMATCVDMDLESHDRMIAYVLGLSHALNIAFFTALAESGEAAPTLAQLSSTTFDAQLAVAARVASESPELYFDIQALNDYGTESLSALLYAVERVRSVVRAGDRDGFTALMERGRGYLEQRARYRR